ncbi:hypothetical protein CPC08DRAFT_689324 [Agrocybe pediades]|nr:hypothetical protein CPC08DRAFT_689324 [Agrocybe pediades]
MQADNYSVSSHLRWSNIPYGIKFELARLISLKELKYEDLTPNRLHALEGSHEEVAAKMSETFRGITALSNIVDAEKFAQELSVQLPWKELDRETEALFKDPFAGIGNNPDFGDWYGGKVQFRARLQVTQGPSPQQKTFKIILEQCNLGASSRFTRRFGSWSFIRVKIPEEIFHDASNNLQAFFQKAFIIWDQVFRACYAKNDNIFLYWTNERASCSLKVPGRLSFSEFINWHNPLAENSNQLVTKWASRLVLGFSNSVPGPRLEQDCILHEDDVLSPTQESDMTDGCGLSTRSLHRLIVNQLNLVYTPTAFQYRLAGYKGMSMIRDNEITDNLESTKIWVRPSQTKIKYPAGAPLDPAQLTIDLLRTPHMRTSVQLSTDIIINLAENKVPHEEFVNLLCASIQELVQGLTTWEGPDALFNLWTNVERAGGVIRARKARAAGGEARVRGYNNRSEEDLKLETDDNDEDGLPEDSRASPQSLAWWADQYSGCPSTLEDTVLYLLDSGFDPCHSPILREKLKKVVVTKIDSRMQNLRFEIAQSCSALAIPDPYGVLGPNEIQVKSSTRNLKLEDGTLSDTILGDVLVTRDPCKGPCDVRKVKAVEHPSLRNYIDVIVFSVQGDRRLIDYLGGGDYDGDTAIVIWKKSLVLPFENANERHSKEPKGLDQSFTRDKESVTDFMERTKPLTELQRCQAMQKYLLGALCDTSKVGLYSSMHDNAIYKYGYSHWRTIKLGYKFCRVLDAPKTGWRIENRTFIEDKKEYRHWQTPLWKAAGKADKLKNVSRPPRDDGNIGYLARGEGLGPFVMDVLRAKAQKEQDRLKAEMDAVFKPLHNKPDEELTKPWDDAVKWAESCTNTQQKATRMKQLGLIAIHVQQVYQKHATVRSRNFTKMPIEVRQDRLREISKIFQSGPSLDDVQDIIFDETTLSRIRASYAYKYDAEQNLKEGDDGVQVQGWSRFPWNVAMRSLGFIKANATGTAKALADPYYQRAKLVPWSR